MSVVTAFVVLQCLHGDVFCDIDLADPQGRHWEPLDVLVDTRSSYTWVPSDILRKLGVPPQIRWEFETADGRIIERDVAQTWARYNGSAHTTFVVFGDEDSTPLLGAYTLEGFRLAADPVNRRLIPVRGLAMPVAGLDPTYEITMTARTTRPSD